LAASKSGSEAIKSAASLSFHNKPRKCYQLPVSPRRHDYDLHPARLYAVLQLPENASAEPEIINRAEQKGIRLYPFTTTRAAGEPDVTMILLGFGGMTANEIEPGIALLSQIRF
jgi:hypothetical protein